MKETEHLGGSTEEDVSSELLDSSVSMPNKRGSARGGAAVSRMSAAVSDSLISSPESDDSRQKGAEKKQSRPLAAAAEWAENINRQRQQTSLSRRLPSQPSRNMEQQNRRTMSHNEKIKVHLRSEQVQDLIGKLSLREQSQHMREVAVSKMTGRKGQKLQKIEKSREVM